MQSLDSEPTPVLALSLETINDMVDEELNLQSFCRELLVFFIFYFIMIFIVIRVKGISGMLGGVLFHFSVIIPSYTVVKYGCNSSINEHHSVPVNV